MGNIKVGSKVKLISNESGSVNGTGSVGVVSEDVYNDGRVFRVIVSGISEDNVANRSSVDNLELVDTVKDQQEEIKRMFEEILRMIVKLNTSK